MPTYTYRREDGTTFETQQRITEDPLEECPDTGQPVERILTRSPGVMTGSTDSSGTENTTGTPACSGPLCGL